MLIFDQKIFELEDQNKEPWTDCMSYIATNCTTDPLYKNYLDIQFDKYLFFNAVLDQNRIIAFGGIEYSPSRWGIKIARVLSRFWVHPEYRTTSLTKWTSDKTRFSPLILKPQLDFLSQQQDIKIAMITREGNYRRSFKEICRLASTVSKDKFEILDSVYDICRFNNSDNSCFQMVALSAITNENKFDIFNKAQQLGFFKELKL